MAVVGFLGTVVQEIHAILGKLVASLCPAEGWNGQNIVEKFASPRLLSTAGGTADISESLLHGSN